MLKYFNVSYNLFADDTQTYSKLDSKDQCDSKLKTVHNTVQTWMFNRKWELNEDRTNVRVVGNPFQSRNNIFPQSV